MSILETNNELDVPVELGDVHCTEIYHLMMKPEYINCNYKLFIFVNIYSYIFTFSTAKWSQLKQT